MKKLFRRSLALLLCAAMLIGSVGAAAAAGLPETKQEAAGTWDVFSNLTVNENLSAARQGLSKFKQIFARCLNLLSDFVINCAVGKPLSLLIPGARSVQRYETFDLDAYGDFYPGMEAFLSVPADEAVWRLGYASHSVMPADFGEKSYAKGAYLPDIFCNTMYRDDDGEEEELRVRTIVLDDGSGRGAAAFCAVDCMGLANADVRRVRSALADFAAQAGIVSVNISATHIHTGIDSQGVWTYPVKTGVGNIFSSEVHYGVDRTFLQAIIDGVKASVEDAYADMKEGRLYYSFTDISAYIWDRTPPYSMDGNLYKLEFVPEDEAATPTIVATFGCHPESSSYDWDSYVDENGKKGYDKNLSADFIWYMEKVVNAAGYNFIFIQGNVGTITSGRGRSNDGDLAPTAHDTAMRYGYELGYITLGMGMDEEERIALNDETGDRLGVRKYADREDYTVWYEGLPTVEATEVEPILNIAHRQFICPVDNNLMAVIAKTAVASNLVLRKNDGSFCTVTEVGYLEIGDALKVYLSPGETFTELLKGGDGIKGFPYKALREALGENVIIFDLMNDAAGYVANDANYVMVGLQYDPGSDSLEDDTWCIISYGKHAGSTFIGNFYELVREKRG